MLLDKTQLALIVSGIGTGMEQYKAVNYQAKPKENIWSPLIGTVDLKGVIKLNPTMSPFYHVGIVNDCIYLSKLIFATEASGRNGCIALTIGCSIEHQIDLHRLLAKTSEVLDAIVKDCVKGGKIDEEVIRKFVLPEVPLSEVRGSRSSGFTPKADSQVKYLYYEQNEKTLKRENLLDLLDWIESEGTSNSYFIIDKKSIFWNETNDTDLLDIGPILSQTDKVRHTRTIRLETIPKDAKITALTSSGKTLYVREGEDLVEYLPQEEFPIEFKVEHNNYKEEVVTYFYHDPKSFSRKIGLEEKKHKVLNLSARGKSLTLQDVVIEKRNGEPVQSLKIYEGRENEWIGCRVKPSTRLYLEELEITRNEFESGKVELKPQPKFKVEVCDKDGNTLNSKDYILLINGRKVTLKETYDSRELNLDEKVTIEVKSPNYGDESLSKLTKDLIDQLDTRIKLPKGNNELNCEIKVLGYNNQPISGAEVTIDYNKGTRQSRTTDEDGIVDVIIENQDNNKINQNDIEVSIHHSAYDSIDKETLEKTYRLQPTTEEITIKVKGDGDANMIIKSLKSSLEGITIKKGKNSLICDIPKIARKDYLDKEVQIKLGKNDSEEFKLGKNIPVTLRQLAQSGVKINRKMSAWMKWAICIVTLILIIGLFLGRCPLSPFVENDAGIDRTIIAPSIKKSLLDQTKNMGDSIRINLNNHFAGDSLEFKVDNLPEGLTLEAHKISGSIKTNTGSQSIITASNSVNEIADTLEWTIKSKLINSGSVKVVVADGLSGDVNGNTKDGKQPKAQNPGSKSKDSGNSAKQNIIDKINGELKDVWTVSNWNNFRSDYDEVKSELDDNTKEQIDDFIRVGEIAYFNHKDINKQYPKEDAKRWLNCDEAIKLLNELNAIGGKSFWSNVQKEKMRKDFRGIKSYKSLKCEVKSLKKLNF